MSDIPMQGQDIQSSWVSINDKNEKWIVQELPSLSKEGEIFLSKAKIPSPVLEEEWEEMKSNLIKISKDWAVDFEEMSNITQITQLISLLFEKKRNNKKEKKEKLLLARLATTRPDSIRNATQVGDISYLPVSIISNVWICIIEVLGFLEEKATPICYDGSIYPTTKEGLKVQKQSITGMNEDELEESEIMKEGDEGVHDNCAWAIQKGMVEADNVNSLVISFRALWGNRDRSKEQNRLIAMVIRLAKSKPKIVPGWNGKIIYNNQIGRFWTAANILFGSIWSEEYTELSPINLQNDMEESMEEEDNSEESHNKASSDERDPDSNKSTEDVLVTPPSILKKKDPAVSEGSPAKKLKTGDYSIIEGRKTSFKENPYSNFSRVKPSTLRVGKKSKKSAEKRTILRARIPVMIEDAMKWNETTNKAIKLMNAIWKLLLMIDPAESTIEVWDKGLKNNSKPLKVDSTFPSSKGNVHGKVIEDLKINWSSSATPTDLRFILGHSKDIDQYIRNKEVVKRLEDMNVELFVDRVQGEKRAVAGYLAGPIIKETSAEMIADILANSPIFKANKVEEIEIFEDAIMIKKGASKKFVRRTRAMHIMVKDEQKALARSCLQVAYPSKVRGDYPMGIQFRFIPNIADPDFAVSPSARTIASRLKAKQASFLDRCITRQNTHFKDIFAKHEYDNNITLLQILMAMKSKKYPDRQLFTCIEQEVEDGVVQFQYAEELENEADGIIPVLPLYLEGQFGKGTSKWIKPSASIGTYGYEYDKDMNKVIPNNENPIQMVNKDWEQRVANKDDYSLSDLESDSDMEEFAIEFGELDLKNSSRISNLGDDSGSLGTLGLAKAVEFVNVDKAEEDNSNNMPKEVTPGKREDILVPVEDMRLLQMIKGNKDILDLIKRTVNNNPAVPSKQDGDGSVT